jgi:hypothetical protein
VNVGRTKRKPNRGGIFAELVSFRRRSAERDQVARKVHGGTDAIRILLTARRRRNGR